MFMNQFSPRSWDPFRKFIVPGDDRKTLIFCVEHWIELAHAAIKNHDAFYVALSGGSTPKAIFERLTSDPYEQRVDWQKIHLFWSDERSTPPDNPDSNYHMAMNAGFKKMNIPAAHIHRMVAEEHIQENALRYEEEIDQVLKGRPFDLVMLGMGEDGHTASLFPHTEGTKVIDRKVIANHIPQKQTWRMSLTFSCINQALHAAIYVLGAAKKTTLAKVLFSPTETEEFPVLKVGTTSNPALWIVDEAAAADLIKERK